MIEWRVATTKDRVLLDSYHCAEPGGGYYDRVRRLRTHTEPWAEEVQKGLRKWRYRVAGSEMWLGFERDELVAAGAYSRATGPDATMDQYVIDYVSCAYAWRGHGLGDQCLGQLLADIDVHTDTRESVGLSAFIHERNTASKALFQRFGFEHERELRAQIREGSGKKRKGPYYGVWIAQL